MKTYTFEKTLTFEEGGIESYDYKCLESGDIYFSERSCYIHALSKSGEIGLYNSFTDYQLESECLRQEIYVNIIDI